MQLLERYMKRKYFHPMGHRWKAWAKHIRNSTAYNWQTLTHLHEAAIYFRNVVNFEISGESKFLSAVCL
jgi:hypothetical protein